MWMVAFSAGCRAEFDARRELIGWMEKAGLQRWLEAPVEITQTQPGVLSMRDQGLFAIQHALLAPEPAADPNIVLCGPIAIPQTVCRVAVVTHGWLDKGQDRWPLEMACAIAGRTDPNQWVCVSWDWRGGSAVVSSVQAAEYARDIAGPRLAKALIRLNLRPRHIHLIGHSAGVWTIQTAASRLAQQYPDADFHLTFLDAYVPSKWIPDELGPVFPGGAAGRRCWAEQYYTRDFTGSVTEHDLAGAHNVDITALDPWIAEHEFPYRWYMATITGRYTRWDERKEEVVTEAEGVRYGFDRSRMAGEANWTRSLDLPLANQAVKIPTPSD